MTEVIKQEARLDGEVRLPWHRPSVQHLTIALDTQSDPSQSPQKTGSGEDLGTYEYSTFTIPG
jgi:hypothetical protein